MTEPRRILVVDDDAEMRALLEDVLGEAGYEVQAVADATSGVLRAEEFSPDLVVTDVVMPGMPGTELLRRLQERDAGVPVILMTAFGSIEAAVQAMKLGAFHYLAKPFRMEQLFGVIQNALLERDLARALARDPAASGGGLEGIVGRSPVMQRVLDQTLRTAATVAPVLLRGESGTGKELFARALHFGGPRREGPFVPVNCSAIPETLIESQLFGHRRGAFTDAREDRPGLVQAAEHGTLFLDEVGDLAPAAQGKLLRLLQEGEIHPVGAVEPTRVDVRIVAATHRDLEASCAQGRFRDDLYHRLNVVSILLPPLRDRPEDLPALVGHFLEKHGRTLGLSGCSVSAEAFEQLRAYAWPGNVRELENAIHRALVLGSAGQIRPRDLPDAVREPTPDHRSEHQVRPLEEVERDLIVKALHAAGGNKSAAARLLGFDRKTLYRRLRALGLADDASH